MHEFRRGDPKRAFRASAARLFALSFPSLPSSLLPWPKRSGPKNKKPTLPVTSGTWASELRALNLYYVRCCLKPEMDVSRHIQQSHGQHIIWQETFILFLRYAKGRNVSTRNARYIADTSHQFLRCRASAIGYAYGSTNRGTSTLSRWR